MRFYLKAMPLITPFIPSALRHSFLKSAIINKLLRQSLQLFV